MFTPENAQLKWPSDWMIQWETELKLKREEEKKHPQKTFQSIAKVSGPGQQCSRCDTILGKLRISQQFCTLGRHFTVHDSTLNFTASAFAYIWIANTFSTSLKKSLSQKNISFAWSTCLGDATFSVLLRLTATNARLLDDALHGERDFRRDSGHLQNANELDKNFFVLSNFSIFLCYVSISVSLHVCVAYFTVCTGHLVTNITQVTDEIHLFVWIP